MPHMDEGQLQAWLDRPRSGLSEAERGEIEAHVASCGSCAARLDELRATDAASGELLGAVGAAEPAMPDFAEIVARSRSLDGSTETQGRPAPRRLPLQWAASIVVAIGVGWMANEVARTDRGVVAPADRPTIAPAAETSPSESEAANVAGDEPPPSPDAEPSAADPVATAETPPVRQPAREQALRRAATPPPAAAGSGLAPLSSEQARAAMALDAAPATGTTWVSGRVTDEEGRPLNDAVLSVTGTSASALSGPDGRFRLRVPSDSVGADAELRATLIGYAVATRDVPVGVGELTLDDLRMEQRAIQLEGVVVTGTAIAAQRREVSSVDRVRVEETETWQRVGAGYAESVLGERALRLPGIPWTEIGAVTIGGAEVIRVVHETADGDVVTLYQSRTDLAVEPDPGDALARRVTETGVHLVAIGPVGRQALTGLVRRTEPIEPTSDPVEGAPQPR